MTILRTLAGLGFILVVFLMGIFVQSFDDFLLNRREKSIGNIFVLGFLFMISFSQILLVPMTLYCTRVSTATIVWWLLVVILSVFTIKRCKKEIVDVLLFIPKKIREFVFEKKYGGIYGFSCVVLIGLQLIGSVFLYHYDDDDSIYVTTVASNITRNHFWHIYGPTGEEASLWSMSQYITNGWYDLITIFCKTTGLPAAVLMHTVLPIIMIALAYTAFWIFSKITIKKDSQRYLFLVFVCLINIFNNVSTHTSSSVLLMRMHQGKAIFANFIVPLMFCLFLEMWGCFETKKNLWILVMANISACAFSTTGLVFGALLTAIYAAIYAVLKKNLKRGISILLTTIPNFVFLTIYIIERTYEVWGC